MKDDEGGGGRVRWTTMRGNTTGVERWERRMARQSARQRVLILEFATPADAERWDTMTPLERMRTLLFNEAAEDDDDETG